jgi:Domain of unknown function (DUF5130)
VETSTLILLFVGIPVALAAVIALFTYVPLWRSSASGIDEPAPVTLVRSSGAAPDPSRLPRDPAFPPAAIGGAEISIEAPFTVGEFAGSSLQDAVDLAHQICGLEFVVLVDDVTAGGDTAARVLSTCATPASAVVLAIDPSGTHAQVATGPDARIALNDRSCEFALLAVKSSMAAGDLTGGLRSAVLMLAEHARTPRVLHLSEPA